MITKRITNLRISFFCFVILFAALTASFTSTNSHTQRAAQNNRASNVSGETGKVEAVPGAQPWMVALVDSGTSNAYNGQFCGASLIHREWVLTAAHCLEGTRANEIDVVIDRHQLSSNAGERIRVAQIIMHPDYVDDDHDIALLRLSKPATKGTIIPLITAATDHLDADGIMARVTGWGVLSEEGDDAPDKLHGVDVPIVADAVCKNAYEPGDIGRYEICARDLQGGADSCYGDSGGPMIVPNANKTGFLQAGIVSWGEGCGLSYGVYTRLTEYEGWIGQYLNGTAQSTPLPTNDENTDLFPASLAFGLEMVESEGDGYNAYAIYESNTHWLIIDTYDDGYRNLNEYLDEMGYPTTGSDIIWVNGTKLFVEELGDGEIGGTMVVDGNLIVIDTTLSLSKLRTIASSLMN